VTKLLTHVKHNVVAYLALFVALGGTSYGAISLPAGSVGSKQLRSGAVTNKKLAKGAVGAADLDRTTVGGYVRGYVQISALGQILASRPAAKMVVWHTDALSPGGTIQWSQGMSSACFALATVVFRGATTAAATALLQTGKGTAVTYIGLSAPEVPVNVAVICPTK
jgi:hypothetical protein